MCNLPRLWIPSKAMTRAIAEHKNFLFNKIHIQKKSKQKKSTHHLNKKGFRIMLVHLLYSRYTVVALSH